MTTSLLRVQAAPAVPSVRAFSETDTSQRECTVTIQRLDRGELASREDTVAVEAELRVQISGRTDVVLARTPGDDLNLIVGHLFCKSMLNTPEEVANIGFCYRGPACADVSLDGNTSLRRSFPERPPVRLAPERLFELKETFERRQDLFKDTGSTHAVALFSLKGRLLAFGEDVGRHNAFDKAIGRALLEGTLGQAAIAMISSRIAMGLAAKAATANIPVLCGFSAATSSGVDYAEKHDITLIGRLRGTSFDVYANAWRIQEGRAPG